MKFEIFYVGGVMKESVFRSNFLSQILKEYLPTGQKALVGKVIGLHFVPLKLRKFEIIVKQSYH